MTKVIRSLIGAQCQEAPRLEVVKGTYLETNFSVASAEAFVFRGDIRSALLPFGRGSDCDSVNGKSRSAAGYAPAYGSAEIELFKLIRHG